MCWITRCVTSVRVHDVVVNLRLSSAPMSHAFNTTVSSAGFKYTVGRVASTTSPLLKKAQNDLAQPSIAGREISRPCYAAPMNLLCVCAFRPFNH